MPKNENVILEVSNLVANLTINREAARNSLSRETLHELLDCINEIKASPLANIRLVILRGAGDKAFVAGADIKLMQSAPIGELNDFIALGQTVMSKLEELQQPVISVIDGFALGGGLELALAGDLIIATERAKLGQPEVALGLIPGFGGTQRLGARVGMGTAKRLIFLGETVSGEEAYRIGLADFYVNSSEVAAKVSEITSTLLAKGPLAIAAAKRATQSTFAKNMLAGLEREVGEFVELFKHSDTKEGLTAFVEKRAAVFTAK